MPLRHDVARRLYGYNRSSTRSTSSSVTSAGGTSVTGSTSTNVSVRYGTATSDSEDGWVYVLLDTAGISGEEATPVHCVCDSPISEGQRVCVLFTTTGNLRAIPIGDNIVDEVSTQIGLTIVDTTIEWAGSDSGTTAPTDGWSQSWPSGSLYVWQRTYTEYANGTSSYSDPVCISYPQEGYDEDATYYATSSTAASTATKVATLVDGSADFSLEEGVVVAVTFTYANTASSPRLNVASTGAKYIYTLGTNSAYWEAGATVLFVYDGTYWQNASSPVWASEVTVGNSASQNVYIDSSHMAVRNGTTEYASFDANSIFLGQSNTGAALKISGNTSTILTAYDDGDEIFKITAGSTSTRLTTDNESIALVNNGESSIMADESGISLSCPSGNLVKTSGASNYLYSSSSYSVGQVCGAVLLYSGSTTGSVTLRYSSANYWRIDIYFSDGSRVQMASTCGQTSSGSYVTNSCSGRYVALTRAVSNSSSGIYISGEYVTISGTTISRGTCLQLGVSTAGVVGVTTQNPFTIVAVVGWKA